MNKKIYGAALLSAILGLTSCSEENPWMGAAGEGAIELSLRSDGTVKNAIPETRAGEPLFEVPGASEFSIHLEKTDGSFSKVYELLEHFQAEESFPTGTYTLRAFYGNIEEEGFRKPYLEGMVTINVLEGRTTEASVLAKVANSLVSVKYTENFKNYLSNYSTTLHSVGHSYVEVPATADEPAFLAPGEVELTVAFSNPQGQSVTLQPTSFLAQPGHHYNMTFDVADGNAGVMELKIIFDDTLAQEDITIDLTEELFTAKAPVINPVGFESGDEIEFLAGSAGADKYRFNVISNGGLNKVTMTLAGDAMSFPFGNEVELMGADATTQQQLANYGFDIKGIFNNPDKMAFVDFSKLPQHLKPGTYTLSLQAKDNLMRASDPVSVKFTAVAPTIEVDPLSAIFGLNQGSLNVKYTGSHPEEDLRFEAMNQHGMYVEAPIVNVGDVTRTRSVETNSYNIIIKLADTERDEIPVKVYLYGNLMEEVKLPVEMPQYSVQHDAFATKVMIKIEASDDQRDIITENLKIYDGATLIASDRITRESENGLITVTGLEPNENYNFKVSLRNANSGAQDVSFTTEEAKDVENGNFTNMSETINIDEIQVGSRYYMIRGIYYTNFSSIIVSTPDGWGDVNSITCDQNSQNQNTWYVVPSTIGNTTDHSVLVRTVGYNHSGPGLADSLVIGSASGVYYGRTSPNETDLTAAAGELYYGTQQAPKTFNTRPSTLTFDYNYTAMNGETAKAEVVVYNGQEEIASGYLNIENGSNKATVSIKGYQFNKKATGIRIRFLSSTASTPSIYIPKDTELKDNPAWNPVSKQILEPNSYKAFAKGSELVVSNVKLNY